MIGNCITQWAHVQDEIFEICLQCLGCSRENAAIVYYRTPTMDARMNLADELVTVALPKPPRKSGGRDYPDLKAWTDIGTQFNALKTPRNQMAHHPVWFRVAGLFRGDPAHTPPINEPSWFEVYVGQNERLRGRSAKSKPLRLNDLRIHLTKLNQLIASLQQFRIQMLVKHVAASSSQGSSPKSVRRPTKSPSTKPQRRRKSSPP
jgi:hypothetical protein